MKNTSFKLKVTKILCSVIGAGTLVSCIELRTIPKALYQNVPDSFTKMSGEKHFKKFEKSSAPFDFKYAKDNSFLEGKTLKIGDKEPVEIETLLENSKVLGFMVIQNDTVKYEKYFNKGGRDVTSNIWSESKSYVALSLAIAVEKGFLKMDDKVLSFFPELKGQVHPNLTVKNLIDMRAEFDYDEEPDGVIGRPGMIVYSPDINYQVLKGIKTLGDPDMSYHYNSNATHLVSMIVAKATGMPFDQFFKENIWDKLGMEYDGGWQTDAMGTPRGFCCLHTTVIDDAKMSRVLLNGGVHNGEQLIPKWFIDQITNNKDWQAGYHYSLSFRNVNIGIPMEEWDGKIPEGARKDLKGQEMTDGKHNWMAFANEDPDYYMAGFLVNIAYVHPKSNTIIIFHGSSLKDMFGGVPWQKVFRAIARGEDTIKDPKVYGGRQYPIVNGQPTIKKGYKLPKE